MLGEFVRKSCSFHSHYCLYWRWPRSIARFQFISVLFAAFTLHFSLGAAYVFSNMVPYIVSYIRVKSNPSNLETQDAVYMVAAHIVGHAMTVALGGYIEKKIGPRLATMLGVVVLDVGLLLSYWTISVSFWWLLVTYGLMVGVGGGLAYAAPITCALRWFTKWKGIAAGVVVGGFGLSSMVFDVVQTAYINPNNLPANSESTADNKYFTEPELLKRVPNIYLIQFGITIVLQLLGCVFLVNPCPEDDKHLLINTQIKESQSQSETPGLKPFEVLKTRNFYVLWIMFFGALISSAFISTLYKGFGLDEVVNDDHFLTGLGVAGAVCNFLGRLAWGFLADATSYKFAFANQTALLTCLLMTLYATTIGGKWMYAIWISLSYFCFGGNYSLYLTAVSKSFGEKYLGVNYGLVFTSHAVSGVISAFITSQLVDLIGWERMILVLSAVSACVFCIVLLHKPHNYVKEK